MPKRTHTITVDDKQLIELLHAIETQVDILNDSVTEDLQVTGLNIKTSVSFTAAEYKEMIEETEKRIDRLVNMQLLYSHLKDKVANLKL